MRPGAEREERMPMGNRIAALIAIGAIMTFSIGPLGCSKGTEDRSDGSGHGQQEDGSRGLCRLELYRIQGSRILGLAVTRLCRLQRRADAIADRYRGRLPRHGTGFELRLRTLAAEDRQQRSHRPGELRTRQYPDGRGQALQTAAIPFPCTERARHRRLTQRRWRCISCMGTRTDLWRWSV